MKRPNRWFWIGLFAVAMLVLLSLAIAPLSNPITRGSTFSRAPDGYGAWYAYVQQQEVQIQRWQRPSEVLWEAEASQPMTLLRVMPAWIPGIEPEWEDWVARGNTLIVLGVWQLPTSAPFSTMQSSDRGAVQIDTRRRSSLDSEEEQLLGDRYGAVVWRTEIKSGAEPGYLIQATTPYLAANAYQNAPGNFGFLADLVTSGKGSVWVDEYLHGYEELQPEDKQAIAQSNWVAYLAQTPLTLLLVQAIALFLAFLWGHRRTGATIPLKQPTPNNSEAYITALAGVLRQAKSTGFVVGVLAKAERLHLQKNLGLGAIPTEEAVLVDAWKQQTKRPATDLKSWLHLTKKLTQRRSPAREPDLATWLKTAQSIRQDRLP